MLMCHMKKFLETTQDKIEQLSGRRKLAHFLQHGEFWGTSLVFARGVTSCAIGFKYQPQCQAETKS